MYSLVELQKLGADVPAVGLAETIVEHDGIIQLLKWNPYYGSYSFNREKTTEAVKATKRGDATSGTASAASFDKINVNTITISGHYEVSKYDIAHAIGANTGNDPVAIQAAAKIKSVGREFSRQFFKGNATTPGTSVSSTTNDGEFDGLETILATSAFSGQIVDPGTAVPLTLGHLDQLLYKVKTKPAEFISMAPAQYFKFIELMRAAGGNDWQILAGKQVAYYNGVPVLVNDWQTAGKVIAGTFDDGSKSMGIAGVAPTVGLAIDDLGPSKTADTHDYRVKMYAGLAVHAIPSVAMLIDVV